MLFISYIFTAISISLSSLNLWQSGFCFSARNGWYSLGDEFPWYNHNQCRFCNYQMICNVKSRRIRRGM
jgi:hypothetical protein